MSFSNSTSMTPPRDSARPDPLIHQERSLTDGATTCRGANAGQDAGGQHELSGFPDPALSPPTDEAYPHCSINGSIISVQAHLSRIMQQPLSSQT
ncbi:hypothetical protein [Bosea sp. LC85]|uniref:hypothetical protein n=1 Tax=Bosea sp. LC85 TaxID=1502851 RepID=UPI00139F2C29|nr:hypothetical protein [Bosea sp. LC85]